MKVKLQLTATIAALSAIAAIRPVSAGQVIEDVGTITCVVDKWDEKEVAKDHKLVDSKSRCVLIPDKQSDPKVHEDCAGKYEYLPDGSWKGTGTCTDNFPSGEKMTLNWEEGSHLKEYTYTKTSGTGKFTRVKGGGTYLYEGLTDTLFAGRYKGRLELQ